MTSFWSELKSLDIKTRNKVRAIISSDIKDSINLMNSLRSKLSGKDLAKIERVTSLSPISKDMMPSLFPSKPQLNDSFNRLCDIPLLKNLEKIDFLIYTNKEKLNSLLYEVGELNDNILLENYSLADSKLDNIINNYGYSNFILRKSVFLHILENVTPEATKYINKCGIRKSLVNSLLYCYEEEQDYLSIKRSAVSVGKERSVYIRDMLRCSFLPIESDKDILNGMLQSALQSSLIDSIILLKVNKRFLDLSGFKNIEDTIDLIDSLNGSLNEILNILSGYDDPEAVFFHRSSAWLENDDVVDYRFLMDFYYDDKESDYISITDQVNDVIDSIVLSENIDDLLDGSYIMRASCKLNNVFNDGYLTRSAAFNFLMSKKSGRFIVSENSFKLLMERTVFLARIMGVSELKNLAILTDSKYVEIISYLLIIKRSEDEFDDFYLRELLQEEIKSNYDNDVFEFVKGFSSSSEAIGSYLYEVFNEGFLSVLSEVVKKSNEVTNIRARLHQWMGDLVNDASYYERANNLIVDHRINLVRGELDDHRIYVDTNKFIEWAQDEFSKDLTTCLLLFSTDLVEDGESQLKRIISKCFEEFYSNNIFGVASYLGRRLRHGTFKGFIYSDTVNEINNRFGDKIGNGDFKQKLDGFNFLFEKEIDRVVKENLHIRSNSKKDAFLDPSVDHPLKESTINSAIKNIREDFDKNGNSYNSIVLINEYCWRLADIDMKYSILKLKDVRNKILSFNFLNPSKFELDYTWKSDFYKTFKHLINEKFNIVNGWFNKPQSVSPKASLGLLFKAVVAEVNDTYSQFHPNTDFEESNDIEIIGGAYHNIYDALYVIIFNAAKHGKSCETLEKSFSFKKYDDFGFIHIRLSSEIKDEDDEAVISERLKFDGIEIDKAQTVENRSGIPKLYNLEKFDSNFKVEKIECVNRKVISELSYRLG